MSDSLRFEVDDRGVATMTLNRPQVRNAFDHDLIEQLGTRLMEVRERDDIRALVITGAGDCFSAGADVNWMRSMAQVSTSPDRPPEEHAAAASSSSSSSAAAAAPPSPRLVPSAVPAVPAVPARLPSPHVGPSSIILAVKAATKPALPCWGLATGLPGWDALMSIPHTTISTVLPTAQSLRFPVPECEKSPIRIQSCIGWP